MSTESVGKYGATLTLDDTEFVKGMNKAEKKMDGFSDNVSNNTNKSSKKMKGFGAALGTMAAGAIAGLGVALVGAGVAGVKMADDLQGSLNSLQASTGATDEEMKGMEESLKNIYNNNFGDSFEDIADSMALVKQNTGLTGQELESTTQNALMLRDTFGKDISESTNTANSLMKQFGISSEEAFNLMAQGIQNGADKNGDLLESLNEYAPQYKALGFSAEEFTNTLIDGAKNGAFSIDKVGDAVKEFNIRAKDGSDATMDAFTSLGLSADEMGAKFAAGGDQGREAFQQVMDSLNDVKDPMEKNRIGVQLFGTQFEDLESKGISALATIGDNASLSKDALGQINEVKYDTFGEAMQGIGRNFQTALIEPMQQYVLPLLSDFAKWISDHMPQIQETISNTFSFIGDIIGGFISVVSNIKDSFMDVASSSNSNFGKMMETISDILGVVQDIISEFTSKVQGFWKKYGDTILEYSQNTFDNIMNVIEGALEIIHGVVNTVLGLLTGDWDKAYSGIKKITSGLFKSLKGLFDQGMNILGTITDIGKQALINIFKSLGDGISSAVSGAVDLVVDKFSNMTSRASSIFDGLFSSAKRIFNKIKSAITSPIETAVSTIKKLVGKIKDAFNFKWSLPKLKLPHVSVSMRKNSWGIPYPDFDISWWAKGGIADKSLLYGVGEAGKEAIIPLENPTYMNPFADAVYHRIADNLKTKNENQTSNNTIHFSEILKIDNFNNDSKFSLDEIVQKVTSEIMKQIRPLGYSPTRIK